MKSGANGRRSNIGCPGRPKSASQPSSSSGDNSMDLAPDFDEFMRPTLENASRLVAAVGAFGFPIAELRPQDVVDVKRVLQMGVEPVQIHVMSAISGVSWEEAWRDRIVGPCGRHQVPFLGHT